MTKIILKSNLQSHQKMVLIFFFIVTFFIGSLMLLALLTGAVSELGWTTGDTFHLMFFPLSLFILLNLMSKNGVVIDNNKLYKSKFIFKKVWFKKKVDMSGMTDISVLKFQGKQKYMFVVAGSPDRAYSVELQKAYLLNEKHTSKKLLFEVNDEEMAQKAVKTITQETDLVFNTYNPRFRSRRRR